MSDAIRVNGNLYSWGSIIVKIGGESYSGFTSVSYGDKRERSVQHGMGRHHAPRGRSAGKYSADNTKLGGPTSTIHAVRQALAAMAADGKSYGNAECQVVVQYVEPDETPMHVEINRCALATDTSSHDEGPDPLKGEIEFSTMYIVRNGLTLFDQSKGFPS